MDMTILGGMEVSANGDLANWIIPGKKVMGMGGAMDLVAGASRVVVTMMHTNGDDMPKVMNTCMLPLTGKGVVDMLITDLAVFKFEPTIKLVEIADGVTLDEVRAKTDCRFEVAEDLKTF